MSADISTRAQFESELLWYLGSVVNGSLPFDDFIKWFSNSEWEDRIASDSAAERAGFGIENILYQIDAYPGDIDSEALVAELDELREHVLANATLKPKVRDKTRGTTDTFTVLLADFPFQRYRSVVTSLTGSPPQLPMLTSARQ